MPTWTLVPLPIAPPGVIEAGSTFAPDSLIDIGVPYYFRASDFLAMVDRLYPEWYIGPLKQNANSGYELLEAYAALFEQVSHSIGELQVQSILAFSSGGQSALASVQFYRPTLTSGSFVVNAGTVVETSGSGRRYQTLVDITFGSGDYVMATLVSSLGQDSDYNVPGPVVLADATVLPGEIDTVVLPYTTPPFADANLSVRQLADAYGGCAPVLDQIGDDRGIDRSANESDPNYKTRVRALPDTVTPSAIRRHLDAIFYQANLHYDHFETWESRYQSCWDAPSGVPTHPIFGDLVTLAYDDPRTDRFIPRWMDERDHRGAIAIVVPIFPSLADRGMAYDDPVLTPTETRATSAWDSPVLDGPSLSGVWDGSDEAGADSRARLLHTTYDLLRSIKGGGVNVSFIQAEATENLPGAPFP